MKESWREQGKLEKDWVPPDVQVSVLPDKLWDEEFSLRLRI